MIRLDDQTAVNPQQITSLCDWGHDQTKVCFTGGHYAIINKPFNTVLQALEEAARS